MNLQQLSAQEDIIVADGVRVDLDQVTVLSDVGLAVPAGSWVGLIGPNGAGKTTLLRAVGGLTRYSGSLLLDGTEVAHWKHRTLARRVAFVRPASSIVFDFCVIDLVMLARSVRKKWLQPFSPADREVADRALASVDLIGFEARSIHTLSSGEQQRVFLAQALAQEPDLLLLDEPTSHLDIHHRFSFLERVRAFVDAGGTAIAAIHDLEMACRFADYLLVLDNGRLVDYGKPARVLTQDLLADVFRVRAHVSTRGDLVETVRYFGSIGNVSMVSSISAPRKSQND